ncbi:hypothetical protein GOODEAATRI_031852 [Goodea atripinnis]|uniref:Carboxylesterase type B domain-containing protein n=1 Tax=Goodea atripinnis TaxID=208336 RepID=A0ABV0P9B3_9TELE
MVWIHGGAFMFGDAMGIHFLDNYLYSGQEIADRGNVIVVTVGYRALTPHNKGFIRRAISQSGVSLCPWAVNRNPRKYAEQVALKVNCPTDDSMAACLKMTDPKVLTLAGTVPLTSSADDPFVNNLVLSPVIDGDFLPDEPSNLFHNAADIDYMVGANDMDGHFFASYDVPSINFPLLATSV